MEKTIVEMYRTDYRLLFKIKDIAEHLYYETKEQRRYGHGDPDMEVFLEQIIENADEAIIHLTKEFANYDDSKVGEKKTDSTEDLSDES